MPEKSEIINRVSKSGLVQLDMADFFPKNEIIEYDIAQNLWQDIALREKEFRAFIKKNSWSEYKGKHVAIICSVDAIIPSWAYMLLTSALQNTALSVHFATAKDTEQELLVDAINTLIEGDFKDTRVVIKGCSDKHVSESAWIAITNKLQPVVKSLMYGEPCSTVPVFKKEKV